MIVNRRSARQDSYLFPAHLMVPIGPGTFKAISGQVGLFFELCTAILFDARHVGLDSTADLCPDCIGENELFLESKASGKCGFLIDSSQVDYYQWAAGAGADVRYVLWSYKGSPSLQSSAKNRGELFATLADRLECVYVVPFKLLLRLLGESRVLDYGKWRGYVGRKQKDSYWRVGRPMLKEASVVRERKIKELVLEYETVEFSMQAFSVYYLGEPDRAEDQP